MNDSDVTRAAHSASRAMRTDRAKGEAEFGRLLQRHPDDGMVFLQRARVREELGLLPDAKADYERAAQLLKYPSWIRQAKEGAARLGGASATTSDLASWRPFVITAQQFEEAAQVFRERESRFVVYEAAQVLLEASIKNYEHLSPVVAVGALIQSWNFAYYKNVACDAAHLVDLELALHSVWNDCLAFRQRDIASFDPATDGPAVGRVFRTFETVLGRVGAPKALHLIAPAFFPLWDNYIAPAYGLELSSVGQNTQTYLTFMTRVQQQVADVRKMPSARSDVLKAIDEFNYCRYSKRWM